MSGQSLLLGSADRAFSSGGHNAKPISGLEPELETSGVERASREVRHPSETGVALHIAATLLTVAKDLGMIDKTPDGNRSAPIDRGRRLVDDIDDAFRKLTTVLSRMGGRPINLGNSIAQLTHAPELILMQLNMELSQIIDNALYSQLADQKKRNAMIADHQTMMDQLRIEKNNIADGDSFNWHDHDTPIDLHPESALRPRDAASAELRRVIDQISADPSLIRIQDKLFENMEGDIEWTYTPNPSGGLIDLRLTDSDGATASAVFSIPYIMSHGGSAELKVLIDRFESLTKEQASDIGTANLFDALVRYGVIEKGKEPGNGGAVEAVMQKIKGVIDKLSSSQQLDMVRLQKMTNSRNEAFSMISNVNKQALDNRMAIVNNLR